MVLHTHMPKLGLAALMAAAFLASGTVRAEKYPERPVTLVVPFSAGGGADLVGRLLSQHLPAHLDNANIVVDNKAGASGNIGAQFVGRAKPDGYTLLLTNSTMTINASLDMMQGFDIRKSLAPIANLVSTPIALAVNSSLPVKSVSDLVDYARKHADTLNYSSCGTGTPQHFAGAKFNLEAKLSMMHVPYKGCAPAINDGVGNQVPVLFSTIPNAAPHAEKGSLRLLGVASKNRLSFMKDVPAIAETAPFQDMDITVWFGVFAPSDVPADIRKKLEDAILATMKDPALRKEFNDRYYEIDVMDSAVFAKQIDSDLSSYKTLAEQSNIVLK